MSALMPERNPLMDLPPMPDTAPPVLTPGLLWVLGVTPRATADYQQAIADFSETYEDFCNRISEGAAT